MKRSKTRLLDYCPARNFKAFIFKAIFIVSILVIFTSCRKRCVACAVENKSGVLIAVKTECDRSTRYLEGYIEGLKQYYKENGDTSTVQCLDIK